MWGMHCEETTGTCVSSTRQRLDVGLPVPSSQRLRLKTHSQNSAQTYVPGKCRGNFLVVVSGSKRLDFCAFTLILVLSILLCWGMKETKTVNNSAPACPAAAAVLTNTMYSNLRIA